MSTRAWWVGVPAALLGLIVFAAVYATTTPRYDLYRLGAAVQRHDVDDALGYFDVERIADHAADVLVADYLARQPAPATAAEANGRQLVATLAKRRIRPQVIDRVRAEVRRSVERAGAQPGSVALPVGVVAVLKGFDITREGPSAWVSYHDPKEGPVRFRMARQSGEPWKISEFDPDWVRRRAREEAVRLR
jgi:hypothetical protein